jgi:hypothetical protein
MVAPLLGMAARLVAKKGAKKSSESLAKEGSYRAAREAAEAEAKKDDLYKKAAIGVGTSGAIGALLANGQDMAAARSRDIDEYKQKKLQEQYEEQDKQEGRGMKSGGKVSSASKRADGCAQRGKTKGRMI